ncbi:hypothetical protein C8J57DRAFT_1591013 [Mycena rebaudengoi]|nr:hypothetical protein C8J57DRAFT_1591013 [Mycena rebaudengoi]
MASLRAADVSRSSSITSGGKSTVERIKSACKRPLGEQDMKVTHGRNWKLQDGAHRPQLFAADGGGRRRKRRQLPSIRYLEGDASDAETPNVDPWSAPLMDLPEAEIPRPSTMHPDKEWAVLVVDDRNFVNAFAAPGLVCVSTGIMPIARNEEGLAAVIGHADMVGLKLMSRACYNPGAAPRFFEDLGKLEKGNIPTFFRTHPPTSERIAHLKTLLPESLNMYNSNPECARLEEMRARGILGKEEARELGRTIG